MPVPELNVLFLYPVNNQPTFSVYAIPDNADPQQLPVLAVALIQCAFEAPKLVPVFLHQDKTHFGDVLWSDKCGELLILPPGVSDEDRAAALSKSNKPSLRCKKAK